MFITVYVDEDTFYDLVLTGNDFNACLNEGLLEDISIFVPIHSIRKTENKNIVTVKGDYNESSH